MKLLIINGPNLNRLGQREPEVYGRKTLGELEEELRAAFPEITLDFFQSNHEGALMDRLHQAADEGVDGIVLNPGGYSHTSVALHDAVASIPVPVVEVHITNIAAREPFRHHSFISAAVHGVISGLGTRGYHLAVRYFAEQAG